MAEKNNNKSLEGGKNDDYCQSTVELQNCLKSIANKVLENVSDEIFIQIYKECYKGFIKKRDIEKPALSGSSSEARKYHSKFNSMLMYSVNNVIDETVLSMDSRLKELEQLKIEQSGNTVCWRPPGNAKQHMVSFEYINENLKKIELENKIKKELEVLNNLKLRLLQKRIKAQEQHKMLLASIDDITNVICKKIEIKEVNN